MGISTGQLQRWLDSNEDEHLEFKEAKTGFEFEDLVRYCAALANEGGGTLILGVTDKRPRKVVGSQAFDNLERTKAGLVERLRLRIEAETLQHPQGRVVVFVVPPRPLGVPVQYKGAYWMRAGQSLVPMTPDLLKRIFAEVEPDFSATVCPRASMADLDPQAIGSFRNMWARKSGNEALRAVSDEQLLRDAELVTPDGLTYAALILFGRRAALGRFLAQAEVVFEYRSSEASGPAQQREEYREGFFLWQDDLWAKINLRNDRQHFQHGFFVLDIATFNETVVREAILNAVSHRDYRLPGSVFVRQYARRLEVVSPGGFPPGINEENVLWRQAPRNRRIAEAFARCGLVERAGQGMDRMFEECIKESKPRPDFAGTDDHQVAVTLRGEVQDPRFLRFLEKLGRERLASFGTRDFLLLDLIRCEQPLPPDLRSRVPALVEQGVIERVGRGKGTRYILSRRLYEFLGESGVYTRQRGLDREANKALLVKHIQDNRRRGCRLAELEQVLPALSRRQIQNLLQELRSARQVHSEGVTRGTRWFPGPSPEMQA